MPSGGEATADGETSPRGENAEPILEQQIEQCFCRCAAMEQLRTLQRVGREGGEGSEKSDQNDRKQRRELRKPPPDQRTDRSGGESAQTVEEAEAALGGAVDLYLDGGPTQGHVSSTVVAADPLARDGIAILREGVIRESVIRRALIVNGGGLGA